MGAVQGCEETANTIELEQWIPAGNSAAWWIQAVL